MLFCYIVSCELGKLYNKDSVIEFLLNRDTFPADIAGHIRNLKDVKELNLTEKKDFDDKATGNNDYVDNQDSRFICPVVGLEMSGKYKFFYNRKCGCVVSDRALKGVKSEVCHKCDEIILDEADLVVINGDDEEVSRLRQLMEERRAKTKAEKRGKKRKNAAELNVAIIDTETVTTTTEPLSIPIPSTSSSSSSNAKTSSWTPGQSAATTTKKSTGALLTDKAKKDYSVAKDPNASETYKSLFTSHETAKKKPAGNWVTYNPLYF